MRIIATFMLLVFPASTFGGIVVTSAQLVGSFDPGNGIEVPIDLSFLNGPAMFESETVLTNGEASAKIEISKVVIDNLLVGFAVSEFTVCQDDASLSAFSAPAVLDVTAFIDFDVVNEDFGPTLEGITRGSVDLQAGNLGAVSFAHTGNWFINGNLARSQFQFSVPPIGNVNRTFQYSSRQDLTPTFIPVGGNGGLAGNYRVTARNAKAFIDLPPAVPEPSSLVLVSCSIGWCCFRRRR